MVGNSAEAATQIARVQASAGATIWRGQGRGPRLSVAPSSRAHGRRGVARGRSYALASRFHRFSESGQPQPQAEKAEGCDLHKAEEGARWSVASRPRIRDQPEHRRPRRRAGCPGRGAFGARRRATRRGASARAGGTGDDGDHDGGRAHHEQGVENQQGSDHRRAFRKLKASASARNRRERLPGDCGRVEPRSGRGAGCPELALGCPPVAQDGGSAVAWTRTLRPRRTATRPSSASRR